ncbi:hypothetical protein OGATHE_001358 [Ogataea polymorpha]|uniref:Uncharacterized protein n=1 Tax=Ogataea polymorpha TaxID=460523 RepID=A0A9P8PR97_9ASCO|nr:hypothetical protein OGATHE_001358 [Ogataea polymorpha]
MTSTPFFLAFSISLGTISAPSLSNRDFPMFMLLTILLKVKAIPPPMIRMSTLSSKLSINWILSDTLAPPKIARNGLTGFSKALEKYSSSLAIRKPAALSLSSKPTMDEWALWAVPKASLTLDLRANTVRQESDLLTQQRLQFASNRLQGEFLVHLTVWSTQMGSQDDNLWLLIQNVLDGWQGSNNSLIVGDLVPIKRNIEVHSDEHSFTCELKVLDG